MWPSIISIATCYVTANSPVYKDGSIVRNYRTVMNLVAKTTVQNWVRQLFLVRYGSKVWSHAIVSVPCVNLRTVLVRYRQHERTNNLILFYSSSHL